MTENKARFNIYLDDNTKNKLKTLSKLNHRSMNNYVVNLINDVYDGIEKNKSNKIELLKKIHKINTDNPDIVVDRDLIYND